MSWNKLFLISHKRAERLIDDRLDAERGDADLSDKDHAWLTSHLESCSRCRDFEAKRRQLLGAVRGMEALQAPTGFAGRVLLAAKTRKLEEVPPVEEIEETPVGRFALVGGLAAVALGVFMVAATIDTSSNVTTGGVTIAGPGSLMSSIDRPHFVVRAPGLGAAKARAQAVQIIDAHGGRYEVSGSAIIAELPRDQLVTIMRNMAKQSRYKVEKSDAGELEPSLERILIRFELD